MRRDHARSARIMLAANAKASTFILARTKQSSDTQGYAERQSRSAATVRFGLKGPHCTRRLAVAKKHSFSRAPTRPSHLRSGIKSQTGYA
jgi:uncharacterized protein YgiB involved in biofilm formation